MRMTRRFSLIRLSLLFTSLTVSLLFLACALGLLPDRQEAMLQGRKSLCEAMAIQFSHCAQRGEVTTFEATTRAIVERTPDLLSAALRKTNGALVFEVG